ncbi:hypothetical protein KIPB_016506, partial [Kipferlia bialata]
RLVNTAVSSVVLGGGKGFAERYRNTVAATVKVLVAAGTLVTNDMQSVTLLTGDTKEEDKEGEGEGEVDPTPTPFSALMDMIHTDLLKHLNDKERATFTE